MLSCFFLVMERADCSILSLYSFLSWLRTPKDLAAGFHSPVRGLLGLNASSNVLDLLLREHVVTLKKVSSGIV